MVDGWDAATYATVVPLSVRSLVGPVRNNITNLTLNSSASGLVGASLAVHGVLSCLPALKTVDLTRYDGYDPPRDMLGRQLLYDALAMLPCLESLKVPGLRALDHLTASASARQHLKWLVLHGLLLEDDRLSAAAASGLAQMDGLRELELYRFPTRDVGLLLDSLPLCLEKPRVDQNVLSLRSGVIAAVEINYCSANTLRDDQQRVEQLLHCKAMGRRLPRLVFGSVEVCDRLPAAITDTLTGLLRCGDQVVVLNVRLSSGAWEHEVWDTLCLLGTWPESFSFYLRDSFKKFCSLPVPWLRATPPPIGQPGPPADSPHLRVPPLPSSWLELPLPLQQEHVAAAIENVVDVFLTNTIRGFILSVLEASGDLSPDTRAADSTRSGSLGSRTSQPGSGTGSQPWAGTSSNGSANGSSSGSSYDSGPKLFLLYGPGVGQLVRTGRSWRGGQRPCTRGCTSGKGRMST